MRGERATLRDTDGHVVEFAVELTELGKCIREEILDHEPGGFYCHVDVDFPIQ